ncbi:predicted protein [Nematostella vectensis]|uniref:Metalloendopeptidase OMA1, mitochondrial n=1 Tax=Nematostella vectensis TaxID=45351 RepID=A7SJG2_NEMVE|nr:predicted protein [Nematostella vectensis]|eukprot:XP_001628220.1 predicted protein [Nematostella vectensis]
MALASIRGGKSFRFQLASVCRQLSRDHSSVTSFERNIAVNTHSPFYSRYPGVNRCNGLLRTSCQRSTVLNDRGFHTTPHRHAWPVAVLLVKLVGPLSKISKLAAMLGGRTFRRWWQKLPAHHKHKLLTLDLLKKRRTEKLILIGGSTGVFFLAYYVYHLEETPITHRRRFMPVGNAQMRDVIEEEYRQVLEQCGEHILPVNHPYHRRVFEVAQRLVMANRSEEIDGIKWQVNVVDTDDVNAFVLPNGQIFMFVGILRMLPNEGALATILGHEMAHAILRHAGHVIKGPLATILGHEMAHAILRHAVGHVIKGMLATILGHEMAHAILRYAVGHVIKGPLATILGHEMGMRFLCRGYTKMPTGVESRLTEHSLRVTMALFLSTSTLLLFLTIVGARNWSVGTGFFGVQSNFSFGINLVGTEFTSSRWKFAMFGFSRAKKCSRPCLYYPNTTATFRVQLEGDLVFKLNPGPLGHDDGSLKNTTNRQWSHTTGRVNTSRIPLTTPS